MDKTLREHIIELKNQQSDIRTIFSKIAKLGLTYYITVNQEDDSFPIVRNEEKSYVLIWTDKELIENFIVNNGSGGIIEEESKPLLSKILNLNVDGIVINLGDESQLVLDKTHLKLLYREILAVDFYMLGGAYVFKKKEDFLVIDVQDIKVLPVSFSEESASSLLEEINVQGEITFISWKKILTYFVAVKCEALVYNFNKKDMTFLKDPYLGWLYDSPFTQ